jgi:hypothetical protein
MEFVKKNADLLLIERAYREMVLLEPTAQLGNHVELVLNGPRCIPLAAQLLGDGVRVRG